VRELPKGWCQTTLDSVVDVLDFEREPINSSERESRVSGKSERDLYPYYGATGQVGLIDSYRSEGQRVLLGEDAAPFLDPVKDKAYLANGRFWVNNHAHVLAGAGGLIDNRFLCHQLNLVDYRPFVTGSTRLKLTSAAMRQLPLVVAPVGEQTRIVAKLEELLSDLDAGVAELKAAQKKLVQYRQSLLKAAVEGALTADWRQHNHPTETGAQLLERILTERRARWEARQLAKFEEQGKTPPKDWQKKYPEPVRPDTADLPELPEGWMWASVDQLSEIQGGIQKQPSRAPVKNKFPFLRVANVARGRLKLDEVHEIELFSGELDRLTLLAGDVLIVEGNGSLTEIGRCAVWDGSIKDAVCQNHLIRVRPIGMEGRFLESWLNSLGGIEKLTKLAATTSGLYTLSVGKIAKVPVPVPPRVEQCKAIESLAEQLSGLELQEQSVGLALKQSAAQRQNILRTAFSGQLVPQDPDDEPASRLLERIRSAQQNHPLSGKRKKPVTRSSKETRC
jgi:type I restriction enzyme S subunit